MKKLYIILNLFFFCFATVFYSSHSIASKATNRTPRGALRAVSISDSGAFERLLATRQWHDGTSSAQLVTSVEHKKTYGNPSIPYRQFSGYLDSGRSYLDAHTERSYGIESRKLLWGSDRSFGRKVEFSIDDLTRGVFFQLDFTSYIDHKMVNASTQLTIPKNAVGALDFKSTFFDLNNRRKHDPFEVSVLWQLANGARKYFVYIITFKRADMRNPHSLSVESVKEINRLDPSHEELDLLEAMIGNN